MTRHYGLASRLSGCAAAISAVLALLATPSVGRANDVGPGCDGCCALLDPDLGSVYMQCMSDCQSGNGPCGTYGCSANDSQNLSRKIYRNMLVI
jgi:hypothetical protein